MNERRETDQVLSPPELLGRLGHNASTRESTENGGRQKLGPGNEEKKQRLHA